MKNNTKFAYFLSFLLFCFPTYGFSFQFILSPDLDADCANPNIHEETEIVRGILENLIAARGFPPENGIPDIVIDSIDIENIPAGMTLKYNKMYIHPKTIEVCKKFCDDYKDALAAIIGHELVHFYQEKKCRFIHGLDEAYALEYEADLQGLFNAYLAGYKIKGKEAETLHSQLTDSLYQAFDLSENSSYPALAERKSMANKTEKTVHKLAELFELANYAVLSGNFQVAIKINEYLLENLKTKELHNNLAIAYASLYKQLHGDGFTYPFELNTDSRLYNPIRSEDIEVEEDSIHLKAIEHFCESSDNSDQDEIFEIALTIIRSDFNKAKARLDAYPKELSPSKIKALEKILKRKKVEKKANLITFNSTATSFMEDCGIEIVYLDNYFPSLHPLTKEINASFDHSKDRTTIQFEDIRFIVHSFQPDCSDKISKESHHVIPHSNGVFHIFTKESIILIEKNGKIIKGAKIWPDFAQ